MNSTLASRQGDPGSNRVAARKSCEVYPGLGILQPQWNPYPTLTPPSCWVRHVCSIGGPQYGSAVCCVVSACDSTDSREIFNDGNPSHPHLLTSIQHSVGWYWQRHVREHLSPWRVPVEKHQRVPIIHLSLFSVPIFLLNLFVAQNLMILYMTRGKPA